MAKELVERNNRNASSEAKRLKLLLVDEDVKDLNYYAEVLRYLGYDVRSVDSYARAATSLGREQFDLVIVDQGSQDFEGRTVLSRAVEVNRHVPVLVLTRMVDADCCIEALNTGAYEYVQKPLTTAEVRELVNDYVKPSTPLVSAVPNYASQESADGADRESWRRAS